MSILECRGLRKDYGSKVAIESLDLVIESGRTIGLLGPNGCGKSTLIKLTAGLLTPTSGSISVCGMPVSEKTNSLISYLPERTYLSSGMCVADLIAYFKDFYSDFDPVKANEMLKVLNIEPTARLRTLSKGTKEKVQLIMVMARKARLYLLDEPIAGVDPSSRDYILSTIISNYSEDAAVLICTHLIYDVEPILDEFMFMGYGGQIVMRDSADNARKTYGKPLDQIFREVFRCCAY